MIYIVDGTGAYNDDTYKGEMKGGFCKRIELTNGAGAKYERGPDLASALKRTGGIADKVYMDLMRTEFPPAFLAPGQRQKPKSPIYLVGHSRGGAAVVIVAKRLAEQSIPVDAMFLFDAVDMTPPFGSDVEMVPWNVEKCYHAIRNEGAEVVLKYEVGELWKKVMQTGGFAALAKEYRSVGSGTFEEFLTFRVTKMAARDPELYRAFEAWKPKALSLERLGVAMRNSWGSTRNDKGDWEPSVPFGNCATKFHSRCKDAKIQAFAGSHGAMGGTPWTTLGCEIASMDRDASLRVWAWMAGKMNACGVQGGNWT